MTYLANMLLLLCAAIVSLGEPVPSVAVDVPSVVSVPLSDHSLATEDAEETRETQESEDTRDSMDLLVSDNGDIDVAAQRDGELIEAQSLRVPSQTRPAVFARGPPAR